jgi:hypothetical protein
VVVLLLVVAASLATAQVTQPPPPTPGAGGLTVPPRAEKSVPGIVEGSVKKVDPSAQTVQISTGLFGILGRTLGVTDQTQIQVDGRPGTLADIREGEKVRAAYEAREGKNVATLIEVVPVPEPSGTGSSPRPSAPGTGMPKGSDSMPPGTKQ